MAAGTGGQPLAQWAGSRVSGDIKYLCPEGGRSHLCRLLPEQRRRLLRQKSGCLFGKHTNIWFSRHTERYGTP